MRERAEVLKEVKTLPLGMKSPHDELLLEMLLDIRDLLLTTNRRLNRLRFE